ncbi:ANTAR domain-containing protein [Streptomyces sp. NPDC018045]|uniref:GAF and ANTAR domain-containing protein n=1 Tax=Streptomyces sp. NPDC018045 TaxID=3365037 RepID=UPI00379ED998
MAREEPLSQVWADLPEAFTGEADCAELLGRWSGHCAGLLGAHAAAVLLADAQHRLRVVAEFGDTARLLGPDGPEEPCDPYADCHRAGTAETDIALTDPRTAARWPRFTALARDRGHITAHALPMRLRSRGVGVLALLSGTAAPLGEQGGAFARSLADLLAVIAVQHKSLERSHAERTQLQRALSSRVVIEQAKGMLAARWAMSVDEAFTVFRAYARAHRRRLSDLARQVVDGTLDSGLVMEYFLNRR